MQYRLAASGLVFALMLAGAGLVQQPDARACMLDQQPSISADGVLAAINGRPPASASALASWAAFVFGGHYPRGQAIALTEDRRQLALALTAAAMHRPWRWTFGDGAMADGWSVRHAYARPGRWRIGVAAYDPGSGRWYTFDQAELEVAAAHGRV